MNLKEVAHHSLPLDQLIPFWSSVDEDGANLEGVRALCLIDRYYLLVRACKRTDMLHPWVYARCREVEREPDGYIDLWGREHYKSTIITFGGTIQRILQDPEVTIGIFSHINSIASDFLRQIKNELEMNRVLQAAFPDILWSEPTKDAKRWSVDGGLVVKRKGNPKESTVEASGLVDGQPIGKHYKLRIYDDVVTDKSTSTAEQIKKTTDSYSLSQSLGVIGGDEWMVGTRYNFGDTYEWILKRGALKARVYAATDTGLKDGKPVYFTQKEWEKRLLKHTDSDIACQYLQNPLSGASKMFNVKDMIEYEVRPQTLAVYVLCDPARSKKKDSANTAMIVVGVDYAMNKYVLDGFNHKMDLQERWENFAQLYTKWKVQPGVQSVKMGYESFGAQSDLDYFKEQMRLPGRPSFPIIELMWPRDGHGSKIDRVQRLVPDCKQHKIMLPYATDPAKLTSNQRKLEGEGYNYRISKSIRRKDENGQVYDLSEHLRMQVHYFPFGSTVDLIDALARIYDVEIKAPRMSDSGYYEPEFA